MSARFLLAMTLIIALPWLVWRLARTERIAPLVVVQMLVGIALGPSLAGAAWPDAHAWLFAPAVVRALDGVAWWAVALFVFLVGLELDLRQTWRDRRDTALTAGLALGVPLFAGAAVASLLLAWHAGFAGAQAQPWQFAVGVGMACAVTALPVLLMLMDRLALTREPLGQRVLRYASLDDIAIWAVLALILIDFDRIGLQALYLAALLPVAWGVRRVVRRLAERDRWPAALLWMATCAALAEFAGLHYVVGAFLAGALLEHDWFPRDRLDLLREHVLLLLMPVFFLSTGLRAEFALGTATVAVAALALLAAAVGGKLAGVALAGRLLRWPHGDAAILGWLLQTKGLVMIVFANILLDVGLISGDSFSALLLMAVASTMLTIPMVGPRLRARGVAAPSPAGEAA